MHGMISWFARNSVSANLLMFVIIAAGVYSLANRVPLEVFPTFERDTVVINMSYRGATPTEVEEAVIIRIEEAIADLDGIKQIDSVAYEDTGRVTVEVEKGRNPRELLDDIKSRVDGISTFPTDVEKPRYSASEFKREVISVAVSGALSEREIRKLGEQVRDELANLPEVSTVELTGVRAYEIAIEVSQDTLDRYDLTLEQVATAIRRSSVDLPAGAIKSSGGEILLRTKGQAYTGEEYGDITVLTRNDGRHIKISDIAIIKDGFEEEPKYSLFNGEPTVMLEVYRTGDESALVVGKAVRDYVDARQMRMPQGVSLDYWRDRSRIVKLRLETLLTSAWQGGLLVFVTLALFLRLSVAIWVCVGIPISFMGALAIMPELGATLNLVSLFAFILVLGIVVDDAIITGENIYSHLKRAESGMQAAIRGAQEVSVPVTFGILTTVAAFVPLLFMEGLRGPIFAQIPMVVIPVLMFSWVESKLILPAHMRHVHMRQNGNGGLWYRFQQIFANGLERAIERIYQPVLKLALKHRYLTFAIFIAVSLILISYALSGRINFTFFPRIASETARATLVMQTGTAEEVTIGHIKRMTAIAKELQNKYTDPASNQSVIKNVLTEMGSSGARSSAGAAESGRVSLELVPPEERLISIDTKKLVGEWRKRIGAIPGAKELNFRAEIGRSGDPIDVQLISNNDEALKEITAKVKTRLSEYPGFFDIQDTLEDGKPEIKLEILPEAEFLGLTAQDLGRQVRQAFYGAEAQRIQRGRDDVRVIVRYPEQERSSVSNLDTMRIRTADGVKVPIGNVSDIRMGQGPAAIQREDRQRTINITADADKSQVDTTRVGLELEQFMRDILVDYPGVRFAFGGELKEQQESFGSLFYGILLTLFAIYSLLAIPLRSYLQPVIVMLVIPFSVVGAIFGHMIAGMSLSFMSILGMLALAGVVVNDSLVLVDWINKKRQQGMAPEEAARVSGVARFRPILLTSLTTFFGLLPLLLEKSTKAQFLIPMAVSLGFGILYATLISLLLIPSLYLILADIKRPFRNAASENADSADSIQA